jgi:glucosamine 6-phosphate synthetase-like amidotransferase/phosphosugar isomerase protein
MELVPSTSPASIACLTFASMFGIVAAVARRNVVPILLEGLKRLEYRGYDSAGVAVVSGTLRRISRAT